MTDRMSLAEYRAQHAAAKKTGRIKGARRTTIGSRTFDSALEAARWQELRILERAGMIADLDCQVKIPLMGLCGPVLTPTGRQMHYVADFTYRENGRVVIEDAKGHQTETYLMKRAVLAAQGYHIREIKKAGGTRR